MEVTNLSSNWKRLQSSLPKPANPPTVLGKRKTRAIEETRPLGSGAQTRDKHKKPHTSKDRHKSKERIKPRSKAMGIFASKPNSAADEIRNPGTLENIAPADSSLSEKPSRSSLRSLKDLINSGLCSSVAVGKYVAIDCEMVGVSSNPSKASMLARVSMVNYHGEQIYDSFVAPKEAVTDYRTFVSGITEELLKDARSFEKVQEEVAALLGGRILVGHAVRHDLDVLMLGHPKRDIRDTSRHKPYRELANGRTPGLKRLAKELLGIEIQAGAHSSIEDARATMMLYKREKNLFEREHVRKFGVDRRQTRPQAIDGEVIALKNRTDTSKSNPGKKKKRKR